MRKSAGVLLGLLAAQVCLCASALGQAGAKNPYYSRRNTFSLFSEYSPDSSHVWLGYAENRTLFTLGGGYARRLWLGRFADLQYSAEVRPVMLESDPVTVTNEVVTVTGGLPGTPGSLSFSGEFVGQACHAGPFSTTSPGLNGTTLSVTGTDSCKRQWTFAEGMSPIGFGASFAPRHRIQPVLTARGGYMFSTQPIPTPQAGSFNFTFEFGAGVEVYQSSDRSKHRSIRAEYRYHHISNKNTASENPGIDMGLFQVTYSFGR